MTLSPIAWPPKGPGEEYDFYVDWAKTLKVDVGTSIEQDQILTSEWVIPQGITASQQWHDTRFTKVWLADGTSGTRYSFINKITTTAGRKFEQTVTIMIVDK